MINLNNETDYKLLVKTKKFYSFFTVINLILFFFIILKLFLIHIEKEEIKENVKYDKSLEFLPTIYDNNGNIIAYSDYNYSIFSNKEKFTYLKRDASSIDIKNILYKSDPSIKFEKILTRKYPYNLIISNFLGKVDIDHKGLSLIEGKVNSLNENVHLSINTQLQQKIFNSLKKDMNNLNPDFALM